MEVMERDLSDPEAQEDEGSLVHIVCCFGYDSPDNTQQVGLCGAPIDNLAPPDYTKDEDCQKCEKLDRETNFCPVFGQCPEHEDQRR